MSREGRERSAHKWLEKTGGAVKAAPKEGMKDEKGERGRDVLLL